jgi:tetratricopeptide (TPR) repeat protein
MARAAVKAKQAQKQKQAAKAGSRRQGRRRHASGGNPNQELFFSRLRRHAKWAYVLLAVLFAVTFAFLGVGSGSSGLSDLFSGLSLFSSSGNSVAKAEKAIEKNPNDPKGYRDLATAYEAKGDTANAIAALQQYTTQKPKDSAAFVELGQLQLSQAQDYVNQYQNAAAAQQAAAPSQPFLPGGKFSTALGTNPIEQAMSNRASGSTTDLYSKAVLAYQNAVSSYQTVAKLKPNNANAQFQLGMAARDAGESTVAVQALKKYLVLNPDTADRGQVEQLIKQLQPAPLKPSSKSVKPKKKSK